MVIYVRDGKVIGGSTIFIVIIIVLAVELVLVQNKCLLIHTRRRGASHR